MKIAVLLVVFNRPDTTYHVFESIREAKPDRLYLAVDGPRKDNLEDMIYVKKTKKLLKNIDWKCEIKTLFRDNNLGCKLAVSSAIDWFFTYEEEGIILEDDCVPSPDFFNFTMLMLKKYRSNPRVMMISGTNYLTSNFTSKYSYFFSNYYAIWGWATWKRAWKKYDLAMKGWSDSNRVELLARTYPQNYMQKHLFNLFKLVQSGKINTWDVQWFYTCLNARAYTITPSVNLITNIGLVGTHTSNDHSNNYLPLKNIDWANFNHPNRIIPNQIYDYTLYEKLFKPNYLNILLTKLNGLIELPLISKVKSVLITYIHNIRIFFSGGVVINVNKTSFPKKALLVYLTIPFTNKMNILRRSHQNFYQVTEIARIVGELGYDVDVVDYNNKNIHLSTKYDLVIDIHPVDNPIYRHNLTPSCVKIAYLTGSNPSFSNAAELERIQRILKEKHVKLTPRRQVPTISRKIEQFDGVLIMGNTLTIKTFTDEFDLPSTYLLPNTSPVFSFSHSNKASSSFLYLGGVGQVHKGLDIVLEAFAKVPSAKLYVCSPFQGENDFANLYRKELYQTTNIIPVGKVDIFSKQFQEIAHECAYSILPSCSEGMSGSIITSMSYGVIPIITKQCGVNTRYGKYIDKLSVNGIINIINQGLTISSNEIRSLSISAKVEANTLYSLYNYNKELTMALTKIIKQSNK